MLIDDMKPGAVIRFPSTGKRFEVEGVKDDWVSLKEIGGPVVDYAPVAQALREAEVVARREEDF